VDNNEAWFELMALLLDGRRVVECEALTRALGDSGGLYETWMIAHEALEHGPTVGHSLRTRTRMGGEVGRG